MKIEIMSGQPQAPVMEKFFKLCTENGAKENDILFFPEKEILNQLTLWGKVESIVKTHLFKDRDLFIVTYSDIVLNAARIWIRKYECESAMLHQVKRSGEDVCCKINDDGSIDVWVEDIFDAYERTLIELF